MEVIRHIFADVIKKNWVFNNGSHDLTEYVLSKINTMSYPPEEFVVK